MRIWPLGLLVAALVLSGAPTAPADPPQAGTALPAVAYVGPEEVATRLRALEGPLAHVEAYGKSAGGRDLLLLRIGHGELPQVLVHGGVGDRDAAGAAAVLDFAARVLAPPVAGQNGPLATVGFLVIPAPNPDALAGFLAGKGYARGGGDVDRDRDGKAGEDGPDDLDGDGEILRMRKKTPTGSFAVDDLPAAPGAPAEPAAKRTGDPRLLKAAGVDIRRAVSYDAPVPEGRDDDGDGDVNEDPPGQDLTRNFIGVWEEAGPWPGEGPFPGSAPEVAALMELSFDTVNLVAWYGFASEGSRLERASERGKEADADDATYALLAPAWKAASGLELRKASERPGAASNPGAELDWAARHLGVVAVRVPVWHIAKEERNGRERQDPDELDWLLWNDRVLEGKGFVPWHEVRHPQWGTVEVGGWRRFTRYEPPRDLLEEAVRKVSMVPAAHAAFAPRLEALAEAVPAGAGVVRVKARAANVGGAPTDSESAVHARRSMGVRLTFAPGEGVSVLAGPKVADAGVLAAGGTSDAVEWLVKAPGKSALGTVTAIHRVAGKATKEVSAP